MAIESGCSGFKVEVADVKDAIQNAVYIALDQRQEVFNKLVEREKQGSGWFFSKPKIHSEAIQSIYKKLQNRFDFIDADDFYMSGWAGLSWAEEMEKAIRVHNGEYVYLSKGDAATVARYRTYTRLFTSEQISNEVLLLSRKYLPKNVKV